MDAVTESTYRDEIIKYFGLIRGGYKEVTLWNCLKLTPLSLVELEEKVKKEGIVITDYLTLTDNSTRVPTVDIQLTQQGFEKFIVSVNPDISTIYYGIFGSAALEAQKVAQEVIIFPEHDTVVESVSEAMEVFNYQGNGVTFKKVGDNIMVNATEMAKPFGKLVADYLRLKATTELRQVLDSQHYGNSHNAMNQSVIVSKGGSNLTDTGTWLHQKLAIDLARWLSPEFNLWTIDTIMEYMQKGTISRTPAVDFSNPLESAKKVAEYAGLFVKSEEGRLLLVAKQVEDEPKVAGYNQMIDKEGLYDFRDIAQVLGIEGYGRTNLVKLMKSGKVKILDKKCVPYQNYISLGYFRIILNLSGAKQTFVTNSGLDFIWRFMHKNKIVSTKLRPATV
jgi:phage antirepressor YoqD-like protein